MAIPPYSSSSAAVGSSSSKSSSRHSHTRSEGSKMMRVAIAGTNYLALSIAHYIKQETNHHLIILSRNHNQQLVDADYQLLLVDYNDPVSVYHSLRGVNTVISTVTGDAQLMLIQAAVHNRVRRFAPAEFDGPPSLRPQDDLNDRGKRAAIQLLLQNRASMEFTLFVCGILYERFAPGGLAASRLGLNSGVSGEGDYVMNPRTMAVYAPIFDEDRDPDVSVCMTSLQDVGRFVTKAINMQQPWSPQMTMRGERMSVLQLTRLVSEVRGRNFTSASWTYPEALRSELALARYQGDRSSIMKAYNHLATAEGRWDYDDSSNSMLNGLFPDIQPVSFREWLRRAWANVP